MKLLSLFILSFLIISLPLFSRAGDDENCGITGNPLVQTSEYSNGTGFLISKKGYIITCHHVIEDAKEIKVRGINGDFRKTIQATIVVHDEKHDIAILKINHTLQKEVPFAINWNPLDVGQDVFTLGYPLKSELGEEIKLTNGIVSCGSGYRGDISTYQVSAPIQPGNSGGPLFDKQGNIVGVMIAKYIAAENASYAVKTNYLKKLIQSAQEPIEVNETNLLEGKPLVEQVKIARNDVLMIEVVNHNNKAVVSK